MQKVVYINPLQEQITMYQTAPYLFTSIEGVGGVDTIINSTVSPGQHGETVHGIRHAPRILKVTGAVKGKNLKDMYKERYQFSSKLDAAIGVGTILYTNDYKTFAIRGVPISSPVIKERRSKYTIFEVQFKCFKPYFKDVTPTVTMLAYLTGAFKFPLSLPSKFGGRGYKQIINSKSRVPIPVDITVYGPAAEPMITNLKSGERIKLVNRALASTDVLHINTDPDDLTVEIIDTTTGAIEDAFGYIDLESELDNLWKLLPGDNAVLYNSGDDTNNTTVYISHQNVYSGA